MHGKKVQELEDDASHVLNEDSTCQLFVIYENLSCHLEQLEGEHGDAGRPKMEIQQAEVKDRLAEQQFQLHVAVVAREALLQQQVDDLVVDVDPADGQLLHADDDEEQASIIHHNHRPFDVVEDFGQKLLVVFTAIVDKLLTLLIVCRAYYTPAEHEEKLADEREVCTISQNAIEVTPCFLVVLRGQLISERGLQ